MAFDLSSLTAYVDQSSKELLTAMQFEAETAKLAGTRVGVKSAQALQLLATVAVPQDGSSCAFNASGSATFTQREINTNPVKFQDSWCVRNLEEYWTQLLVKKGQNYNESDIPKEIFKDLLGGFMQTLETADWKGDTTSVNAYLNKYDGFIKIIKAASGTNVATAVAGPVTTSNVRTIMQNIVAKISSVSTLVGKPQIKIYCGYDVAELYRQKLFIDNLYHVAGIGDQKGMTAEGSVHEIVPVHGLDGLISNSGDNPFIFAMDLKNNAFIGMDMLNEEEQFKVGLDQYEENVWYSVRFRRGVQIAYPSEIVEYSNS